MAIRPILRLGHPVLRQIAAPVTELGTPALRELVHDLLDTMRANDGAGLAAIQIGVLQRVVVFELTANPRYPDAEPVPLTVLVNPEIEILGDERELGWEGCLSVPGMRGLVPRYRRLRYRGFDELGAPIDRTVDGFSRARRAARMRSPRRHPLSAANRGHDGVRLSGRARRERRVAARRGRRGLRAAAIGDGSVADVRSPLGAAALGLAGGVEARCPGRRAHGARRRVLVGAGRARRAAVRVDLHELPRDRGIHGGRRLSRGRRRETALGDVRVHLGRDARGRSRVAASRGLCGRPRVHLQRLRPAERRNRLAASIRTRSRRSRSFVPRLRAASYAAARRPRTDCALRLYFRAHDDAELTRRFAAVGGIHADDAAAAQGGARVQRRASCARSSRSRRRAGTAAAQRRLRPGGAGASSRSPTSSRRCCCSRSTR